MSDRPRISAVPILVLPGARPFRHGRNRQDSTRRSSHRWPERVRLFPRRVSTQFRLRPGESATAVLDATQSTMDQFRQLQTAHGAALSSFAGFSPPPRSLLSSFVGLSPPFLELIEFVCRVSPRLHRRFDCHFGRWVRLLRLSDCWTRGPYSGDRSIEPHDSVTDLMVMQAVLNSG
jgi:hypothetical protein